MSSEALEDAAFTALQARDAARRAQNHKGRQAAAAHGKGCKPSKGDADKGDADTKKAIANKKRKVPDQWPCPVGKATVYIDEPGKRFKLKLSVIS